MLRKIWFGSTIFLLLVSGVALGLYGSTLPQYHDQRAGSDLYQNAMVDEACTPVGWHAKMDALRTNRYPLINIGCTLLAVGLSLLTLFIFLRSMKIGNSPIWRTPSEKWHFFAVGALLTFCSFLAVAYGFALDSERQMLPWCADSIAIPIFGLLLAFPVVLGILAIGGFICAVAFGELPVGLFIWDNSNAVKSWIVSILFGAISLLIGFTILDSAATSDCFIAAPGIFAIYLTLATRAAILAPRREEIA